MNLPYRPIIIIAKTKFEKICDFVGFGLFISSIIYLLVNWGDLPDQVPAHFNSVGEVDRHGSKFEMIILPIVGTFLSILLSLLEKAPHMHNYPNRINESNVEQFYLTSRKMLNFLKNILLVFFAFLIVQIVKVSIGEITTSTTSFLPILLISVFGTIGMGIYKQSKIN